MRSNDQMISPGPVKTLKERKWKNIVKKVSMNKNEIVGVLFIHNTFHIIHFCLSKEQVHLSGAKTPPPPPPP